MNKDDKILIFGGNGMVGSAIVRSLTKNGYTNITNPPSKRHDLTTQYDTYTAMREYNPDVVIMAAGKVGGIKANIKAPADFGYINGMMALNVIHGCYKYEIKKMIYLGSSCIYPKHCEQPMSEDKLLTGPFEPTNEMYALSKVYGIKLCEAYNKQYGTNYISVQPCNIYGVKDNFNPETGHAVANLIVKIHNAKVNQIESIEMLGKESTRRELMYVDDCADACVFLLEGYNDTPFINVGTGEDATMREIAYAIKEVVGYKGNLVWKNEDTMVGMDRKVLDVSKLNALGWKHKTSFAEGLKLTYDWYLSNIVEKK